MHSALYPHGYVGRNHFTELAGLDNIIKRIYEDNINGKLTDERFIKMSRDYEREQDELKAFVEATRKELKEQEKSKNNVKGFIATTKKCTEVKELDATVLRAFISEVIVSEKDKETNTQNVQIEYNFIGAFDFGAAIEKANTPKKRRSGGRL